jgi:hypothetical protein
MKRLLPLILLATLTTGCASQFGLTPEQRQVLEDPQGIEKLDAEIARLPEGPSKDKLKDIRSKLGDARSYEEAAENAVAKYTPYGAGAVLVLLYRLWKRSRSKDDVIRQIVAGVEAADKTPELKTALAISTDESTKKVIDQFKAGLPKVPEVPSVPEVVTK